MRDINLKKLIDNLNKNLDYYASIPADGEANFEEAYHQVTKDPDGKVRHLLDEREYSLSCTKEITDYLDTLSPGKILDFGCGLGWILSYLDEKWDKHGLEVSQFASSHAGKFGKIFNGFFESYDEKNFDVIIMNHVIEHVPDPIKTIKKVKKILNKDGVLIIATPDFDSAAARRYGSKFRLLHDPTHISLFTLDSMHRFLRDHDFFISKVEMPYFDTPWFNKENILKILDTKNISPPFYGSFMTFFCYNK
tara:strand:+ start:357 stop:1106 length:750 start_codon:yes stop_codon:yes gene_type:complete